MMPKKDQQMIENSTILLTVPEENENRAKDIIFPSKEEIIDILKENGESFSNITVTNNSTFYQQQPIAVVWDQDEGSRCCINNKIIYLFCYFE